MKSRLDAIWKAVGMIKDGMAQATAAIAEYESYLAQQSAAAQTLDTKIDRLNKTEADLAAKSSEHTEVCAKLESAKAALAKIKESL